MILLFGFAYEVKGDFDAVTAIYLDAKLRKNPRGKKSFPRG
jgi:hypothetical protein